MMSRLGCSKMVRRSSAGRVLIVGIVTGFKMEDLSKLRGTFRCRFWADRF